MMKRTGTGVLIEKILYFEYAVIGKVKGTNVKNFYYFQKRYLSVLKTVVGYLE